MEKERASHDEALERLRSELRTKVDRDLAERAAKLEIAKEAITRDRIDRIAIYRVAVDLVASIVTKAEMALSGQREPLTPTEHQEFEAQRLRIYAYMGMHAPQEVMDANDALTDYVLSVLYDGKEGEVGARVTKRHSPGSRDQPTAHRVSKVEVKAAHIQGQLAA
jgi:hypothetical protein